MSDPVSPATQSDMWGGYRPTAFFLARHLLRCAIAIFFRVAAENFRFGNEGAWPFN